MVPRGFDHIAGFAAITRNATLHSKLLQRNAAAVEGEHAAERGGATLGGFHLQHRWRFHPFPLQAASATPPEAVREAKHLRAWVPAPRHAQLDQIVELLRRAEPVERSLTKDGSAHGFF